MKMSTPISPISKGKHVGIKCEDQDEESDITFVSITGNMKNGSLTSDKVKKKKKKKKNNDVNEHLSSSMNGNADTQLTENESESLLKTKKKKPKKKDHNDHHIDNVQSQSFLSGINMSEQVLTDESEITDSDNRKKRKIKSETINNNEPLKKKPKVHVLTQDIFAPTCTETFFNSTPFNTQKAKKKVKKEHLKPEQNDNKDLTGSMNGTGNSLSADESALWFEVSVDYEQLATQVEQQSTEDSKDSKLHSTLDLSDLEDDINNHDEPNNNSSTKKDDSVSSNSANSIMDSSLFCQQIMTLGDTDGSVGKAKSCLINDDTGPTSPIILKKKNSVGKAESCLINDGPANSIILKKKSSVGKAESCLINDDNVPESPIILKKKKKKLKESSEILDELEPIVPSARDSMSPEFDGAFRKKKKKLKETNETGESLNEGSSRFKREENVVFVDTSINKLDANQCMRMDDTDDPLGQPEDSLINVDRSTTLEPNGLKKKKKSKGTSEVINELITSIRDSFSQESNDASKKKKTKSKDRNSNSESFNKDSSSVKQEPQLFNDNADTDENKQDNSNLLDESSISNIDSSKTTEPNIPRSKKRSLDKTTEPNIPKRKKRSHNESLTDDDSTIASNSRAVAARDSISPDSTKTFNIPRSKKKTLNETTESNIPKRKNRTHNESLTDDDSKIASKSRVVAAQNSISPDSKKKLTCQTKKSKICSDEFISSRRKTEKNQDLVKNPVKRSNRKLANSSDDNYSDVKEEMDSSSSGSENEKPGKSKHGKKPKFKASIEKALSEVNFAVAQLHKIVDRASKPTVEQRALIVINDLNVKFGKFTLKEDKQIRENWKYFIEETKVDDNPEYFFSLAKNIVSKTAKRNFLYYLARNMPERTPFSVFRRFKILMRNTKHGRYTEAEDDLLIQMLKDRKDENHYCTTEIAQRLNRPVSSVEKRIRIIEEAHTRKIKWRNNNAAAFIKYLLKITKTREADIATLKDRHITSEDWRRLSKKLDGVPIRILKRVWLVKLYPGLFIPDNTLDLRKVRLKLIQMFHENNETDWRRVNWSEYASHFEGLTYLKIYTLMKLLVQAFVPKDKSHNLKKCIKSLMTVTRHQMRPHVLHKIKYSNGEIQELKYHDVKEQ